ncbi:MAG TPA: MATE family efflux transporter [Gammaproteobacteria bacterium]|jgi:Na+-driven multidrug efflux pump|nr:MATE family efflux transporter [Gammaproteobacteria bacterium]
MNTVTNIKKQNGWISFLNKISASYALMMPILIAQLLQRLYPVIDNHFIGILGRQSLYLHNVQLNFIIFGQFIGTATSISILVFWRRKECVNQQGHILIKHLLSTLLLTMSVALTAWLFSDKIMLAYHVDISSMTIAKTYLGIGLINMILQAIYISLDGVLVASKLQKFSMLIAAGLVTCNIIADRLSISYFFSDNDAATPLLLIGLSTTGILLLAITLSTRKILRHIHGWSSFSIKEMMRVWCSELGVYLIRGVTPFIYTYQLCLITASAGFIVTYQLALQLSYLFCLPLLASMQIAVSEASETASEKTNTSNWWHPLFYTGILPTTALLAIGIFAAIPILEIAFHYLPASDHLNYLPIFFISCWIGQWGNVFTVPLRAKKLSYLVTKNFFIAELIILLGGTQLLIMLNLATPLTVAYTTLLFSSVYLVLNIRNTRMINQTSVVRMS